MAVVYEIYENGQLIKTIKNLDKIDSFIQKYKEKHGYKCIYEGLGGDNGRYIFVNIKKQKTSFIAYKEFLGVYDKKGKKLYNGDIIRDEYGNEAEISEHYNWSGDLKAKPTYYYRVQKPHSWGYSEYDITDFSKYIKVHDIFESFTI